jgi:hypothetical protein
MSGYYHGLIDEIEFWRELINESSLSVDSPEYQRMEYALQLAEYKFAKYERETASSRQDKARLINSNSK